MVWRRHKNGWRKSSGGVRSWRSLLRDRGAVVAIEMGIVGPPFLLLMVFLTELTYDFYAQEALNYGVAAAARCVQVGAAQGANSAATFETSFLCPAVGTLLPCGSISINIVQLPNGDNYQNYGTVGLPRNANGKLDTSSFGYTPGTPNTLMLVQAIYTSPSLVANFVPGFAIASGSTFVHATMSSAGFMNENFPITATPPSTC